MANLSITIPDALIPDFVEMAEAYLTATGIDFGTMTDPQKVRKYIVEVLKSAHEGYTSVKAAEEAQQAIQDAIDAAREAAGGIS